MIFFPYNLLEQSPIAFQLMGMSESIFQGEFYRFLSSIWFHGNVVHLASNLLFLFIFSIRLEELTKGRTVFIVFICSGIIGNIGTILWIISGIPIISVGASGAIFGLLGALFYILKGKSKTEQRKMIYFLIIFFTITISQDTNFFSHFFGMIGGIAIIRILSYISDRNSFQFV
jgi:rhomboid protease GluP